VTYALIFGPKYYALLYRQQEIADWSDTRSKTPTAITRGSNLDSIHLSTVTPKSNSKNDVSTRSSSKNASSEKNSGKIDSKTHNSPATSSSPSSSSSSSSSETSDEASPIAASDDWDSRYFHPHSLVCVIFFFLTSSPICFCNFLLLNWLNLYNFTLFKIIHKGWKGKKRGLGGYHQRRNNSNSNLSHKSPNFATNCFEFLSLTQPSV